MIFKPIFIVGASRSGTTMMGRILGKSDEVFTFRELHFFEQCWTPDSRNAVLSRQKVLRLASNLLSIQKEGYLTRRNPLTFYNEAEKMLSTAGLQSALPAFEIFRIFLLHECKKNNKTIPCDQTPRNIFYLQEILDLYPESRIINMIRDPRDVLLSQKGKWRRRFLGGKRIPLHETFRAKINYHPITTSKLWVSAVKASDTFRNHPRVCTVFFEDLLTEREKTVRKVCDFIQIPYGDKLLEIPHVGSSNISDKPRQKGVNPEIMNNWKNSGKLSVSEMYLCQKISAPFMKKYGYSVHPIKPDYFSLSVSLLLLPLQLAIAFLFNIRRMKNIFYAIKRRIL